MTLGTAAALGDRFGRRALLAFGIGLFTLSSMGCAVAPTVGWLIAARAVQGIGAAFTFSLTVALVGATFPAERRGAALGILQGLTGLATAGGPVIGGAIAQGLDWRFVFWVNVPLGVVAVPLVLTRIPESRGGAGRLDPLGVGLVTAGLVAVVWALVRGNDAGWGSAEIVGSFAAGAVLLWAFVAWERRAPAPMLPLRLYRSRSFAAGNVASFALFGSLFAAVYFVAQFLQSGLGYSPLQAGVRMLPWTLTLLIVAPLSGRLVDRHGARAYVVAGLGAQAVGMLWLVLVADPGVAYVQLVPGMVLAGAGLSMAMPAAQAAVLRRSPRPTWARRPGRPAPCAKWAPCSGSRSRSPCSRRPAATSRRRRSPTASPARSRSRPRLASSAPRRACCCRGRGLRFLGSTQVLDSHAVA